MAHTSSGLAATAAETDRLGPVVVAGLLQSERLHPSDEGGVRVGGVQLGQRPAGPVPQVAGVGEEEVEEVADNQGEEVTRPPSQDAVERAGGTQPVTVQPLADGGGMHGLPIVGWKGAHRIMAARAIGRSGASLLVR